MNTCIETIHAREILDSRGNPTVKGRSRSGRPMVEKDNGPYFSPISRQPMTSAPHNYFHDKASRIIPRWHGTNNENLDR